MEIPPRALNFMITDCKGLLRGKRGNGSTTMDDDGDALARKTGSRALLYRHDWQCSRARFVIALVSWPVRGYLDGVIISPNAILVNFRNDQDAFPGIEDHLSRMTDCTFLHRRSRRYAI